jgi:hypothetical protein
MLGMNNVTVVGWQKGQGNLRYCAQRMHTHLERTTTSWESPTRHWRPTVRLGHQETKPSAFKSHL